MYRVRCSIGFQHNSIMLFPYISIQFFAISTALLLLLIHTLCSSPCNTVHSMCFCYFAIHSKPAVILKSCYFAIYACYFATINLRRRDILLLILCYFVILQLWSQKSCYFAIHAILLLGSYDLTTEVVLFCYSCYFAIRYSYGLRTEVVLFCYLCYFVVSVRRYASLLLMLFCYFQLVLEAVLFCYLCYFAILVKSQRLCYFATYAILLLSIAKQQ